MADMRTPARRAAGLGSARSGTAHWIGINRTSILLIPLVLLALPPLAASLGAPYEVMRDTYQDPVNAIVLILLIGVTFRHLQQGLQVVIEDYVHDEPWRTVSLLGNVALCGAAGLAGVFAVAKIAFGA